MIDLTQDDDNDEYMFYVHQTPKAMPRARKYRMIWVNTARRLQDAFRAEAAANLPTTVGPLFDKDVSLAVELVFYLPRPNSDFKGNKRDLFGFRLKESRRCAYPPTGPDIDNLAKFVLDALNGLVYHDDRQVVQLVVYKLREETGCLTGCTRVTVHPYDGSLT